MSSKVASDINVYMTRFDICAIDFLHMEKIVTDMHKGTMLDERLQYPTNR